MAPWDTVFLQHGQDSMGWNNQRLVWSGRKIVPWYVGCLRICWAIDRAQRPWPHVRRSSERSFFFWAPVFSKGSVEWSETFSHWNFFVGPSRSQHSWIGDGPGGATAADLGWAEVGSWENFLWKELGPAGFWFEFWIVWLCIFTIRGVEIRGAYFWGSWRMDPPNKPPKWVGCHLGFMKGPRPQSPAGRQRQRERRSAESWNNLRAPGSSEFELGDGAWKNKSWTEWLDHFFLAIYFWLWILGQGFRRKKVGWVATSLNVQAIVQRLRTEVKGSGCVLQETNRETMGLPILQLGKAWTGWTFSQGLVSYLGQSKAERPCRRRSHRWRLRCIWRQLLLKPSSASQHQAEHFLPPKKSPSQNW